MSLSLNLSNKKITDIKLEEIKNGINRTRNNSYNYTKYFFK